MFSFSSKPVALLTDEALDKLRSFKEKVLQLSKMEEGSSEYSQKMVENVLLIIDSFLENNTISYWKEKKNQASLRKLMAVLDNGNGSFVPEVFNDQSLKLAELLNSFLIEININNDVHSFTKMALNSLVNVVAWIDMMRENLRFKIDFYQSLSKASEFEEKFQLTKQRILEAYDQFIQEVTELSPERYQVFVESYLERCEGLIDMATDLPYIRICNSASFVNLKEPFVLDPSDLKSAGNRANCILQLIGSEQELNKKLLEKNLPPITFVYDHYFKKFVQKKSKENEEIFADLVRELMEATDKYKLGEHLGSYAMRMFKHVDEDKIKCFYALSNQALEKLMNKTTPTGVRCFEVFGFILEAANKNREISVRKDISLGELSKLINHAAAKFFDFSYNKVDETNSSSIGNSLLMYENAVLKQNEEAATSSFRPGRN